MEMANAEVFGPVGTGGIRLPRIGRVALIPTSSKQAEVLGTRSLVRRSQPRLLSRRATACPAGHVDVPGHLLGSCPSQRIIWSCCRHGSPARCYYHGTPCDHLAPLARATIVSLPCFHAVHDDQVVVIVRAVLDATCEPSGDEAASPGIW